MTPPINTTESMDTQNENANGRFLGPVDLDEHAQLVSRYISDFDLVDIGTRLDKIAPDLKDVRNILVTGGAGFM
jgi:hypothetical protein